MKLALLIGFACVWLAQADLNQQQLQQEILGNIAAMTSEYVNTELDYLSDEEKAAFKRTLDQLQAAPACCNGGTGGSGGGGGFGSPCPPEFTYSQKLNTCFMMLREPATYDQSLALCQGYSLNGRLATLDTKEKAVEIRRLVYTSRVQGACGVFIIGSQREDLAYCGSKFVWKKPEGNVAQTYTEWNGGEPNCAGQVEFCTEVWAHEDRFRWNDRPCYENRCALCEIPL